MHTHVLAVALAVVAAGAGRPQGAVTEVSAEAPAGQPEVVVTVRGSNPCGAVTVDYGDGTKITHAIVALPSTHAHQYAKAGEYRVSAGGNGNCGGQSATSITVDQAHVRARPETEPAATTPPLAAMAALDLDGNGTIWLEEWKSAPERFRSIDRNNDDALSPQEVEAGAADIFASLDENGDRRIGPREWRTPRQSFDRYDHNSDGFVTPAEFGVTAAEVRAAAQAGRTEEPAGRTTPGRMAGGRARGLGKSGATIVVQGADPWTDTGLTVQEGERLSFTASGSIRLSADGKDMATPRGARSGRRAANAPLPETSAGALIARVGNSPPFVIGNETTALRMPASGRLFLGINDDYTDDNNGTFRVTVAVER